MMPFEPAVLDPGGARPMLDLVCWGALFVLLLIVNYAINRRRAKLTPEQREAEDREMRDGGW